MKPSLDEQLMTLIRAGGQDRGTLRRWGKKNGYLVSTIDNAVTRLILHEGRIKPDDNGRLVELPPSKPLVYTGIEVGAHMGRDHGKARLRLDPLEEIARAGDMSVMTSPTKGGRSVR